MIEPRQIVARALERGSLRGPVARAAASFWERFADPVRPLRLPEAHVIGVGGATLGGAGKTPFVAALASLLPRCAVVASGYRARCREPRRVLASDPAELVGDEAALLARALEQHAVPVIVARDRQRALALAARHAPIVVVDGLLQALPERLGLSVLVVDASEPWGSDACPPSGDRRAERELLLRACDLVVRVERCGADTAPFDSAGRASFVAPGRIEGAVTPEGRSVPLAELAELSLGAVLAVARPERILSDLAAQGVYPELVRLASDHSRPVPSRRAARVDAWLTTAKCATKIGAKFEGAPVWTLAHRVGVPAGVLAVLSAKFPC